jgi:hypothetical protein
MYAASNRAICSCSRRNVPLRLFPLPGKNHPGTLTRHLIHLKTRTATTLSPLNSSLLMTSRLGPNTHCVNVITSGGWTSFARTAVKHFVGHMLQHSITSIMLSISPALFAQPRLDPKTATMNTKDMCSATSSTRLSLPSDAVVVRLLFSSNSWRFSAMVKINIGIQNAT